MPNKNNKFSGYQTFTRNQNSSGDNEASRALFTTLRDHGIEFLRGTPEFFTPVKELQILTKDAIHDPRFQNNIQEVRRALLQDAGMATYGVPLPNLTYYDPETIEMLVNFNPFFDNVVDAFGNTVSLSSVIESKAFGEIFKTAQVRFKRTTFAGNSAEYSDYSTDGNVNNNLESIYRDTVTLQTGIHWGIQELAVYEAAGFDDLGDKRRAVMTLTQQDIKYIKIWGYGDTNKDIRGLLTDTDLDAFIAEPAKWETLTTKQVTDKVSTLLGDIMIKGGAHLHPHSRYVIITSPAILNVLVRMPETTTVYKSALDYIREQYPNTIIIPMAEYYDATTDSSLVQAFPVELKGIKTVQDLYVSRFVSFGAVQQPNGTSWAEKIAYSDAGIGLVFPKLVRGYSGA